jgi:ribokinase
LAKSRKKGINPRWDILGFGAVAVDDLLYVDHYPQPNSKMRIQGRRREGGGLTGTALVAAARLGAKVAYGGVLGHDELSRFTIQELEREGVDCSSILRRDKAQPFYSTIIVVQPTAQRTVLSYAGGVHQIRPEEISDELIANCRVLFVDHTVVEGGLRAVELAHRHNIPVTGDFEAERHPRVYDLMDRVDHLVIGVDFARQVTGKSNPEEMVRALANPDRACCVVTAGERGCWYSERDNEVHQFPAFHVQAVDTTGCGDVFHGAYAACIAQGESVNRAIQIATTAAGIKATHSGGRSGIPDRTTIDRFLSASPDRR